MAAPVAAPVVTPATFGAHYPIPARAVDVILLAGSHVPTRDELELNYTEFYPGHSLLEDVQRERVVMSQSHGPARQVPHTALDRFVRLQKKLDEGDLPSAATTLFDETGNEVPANEDCDCGKGLTPYEHPLATNEVIVCMNCIGTCTRCHTQMPTFIYNLESDDDGQGSMEPICNTCAINLAGTRYAFSCKGCFLLTTATMMYALSPQDLTETFRQGCCFMCIWDKEEVDPIDPPTPVPADEHEDEEGDDDFMDSAEVHELVDHAPSSAPAA